MMNVFSNHLLWYDAVSNPTSLWNGTAYVAQNLSDNVRLQSYTTVSGDYISVGATCSGTIPAGALQVVVNGSVISNQNGDTVFTVIGTSVQYSKWLLPSGVTDVDVIFSATGSSTTTLTAIPEDPPPPPVIASNESMYVYEGSAANVVPISFTQSGGSVPAVPSVVSSPTNGIAHINGTSLYYTPNPGFNGADSLTYNGVYGGVTSNTATVNITVNQTAGTVMLRWSDDGGHNWSNRTEVSSGFIGQTSQRVMFRRLGSTRRNTGLDRIFEISGDDYSQVAIIGASIDDG